jgi:hypothetical protein
MRANGSGYVSRPPFGVKPRETITIITRINPWMRISSTSRKRMPRPCRSQQGTRTTQIPHDLTKIPAQIGPAQTGRNPLSFSPQPGSMMRCNCS